MSSLSRTMARASNRGKKLMKQYQGPGAYDAAEKQYEKARLAKREKVKA